MTIRVNRLVNMIPFNVIILASAFGVLFSLSVAADFDGNKEVGFFVYTRRTKDGIQVEIGDDEQLKVAGFDWLYMNKIIIHGFDDSFEGDEVQALKDAYLEKTKHNVIMVDWSGLAERYKDARANARNIGHYVAEFILYLQDGHGISLDYFHIIGFELGAHIAGFVSDLIASPPVGRITGLDPMGFQEWEKASPFNALDKYDAFTVDVFHTSSIGIKKPIGDVDFYPNGGMNQTVCKTDKKPHYCDHMASVKFFIDSIFNPQNYTAVKCVDVEQANRGTCKGEEAQLGEFMSHHTYGVYYKYI